MQVYLLTQGSIYQRILKSHNGGGGGGGGNQDSTVELNFKHFFNLLNLRNYLTLKTSTPFQILSSCRSIFFPKQELCNSN